MPNLGSRDIAEISAPATLPKSQPLRPCRNIRRRDSCRNLRRCETPDISAAAATLPKSRPPRHCRNLGRDDIAEISAPATSAAVTLLKSRPPRNCRNLGRRRDFTEIYRNLGRRDGLNPKIRRICWICYPANRRICEKFRHRCNFTLMAGWLARCDDLLDLLFG